jgi:hypothetical protein
VAEGSKKQRHRLLDTISLMATCSQVLTAVISETIVYMPHKHDLDAFAFEEQRRKLLYRLLGVGRMAR